MSTRRRTSSAALLLAVLLGAACNEDALETDVDLGQSSGIDAGAGPGCEHVPSPSYCLAGQGVGATCGHCDVPSTRCELFEAEMTCECDHLWHCTECGGSNCEAACRKPDGGYTCD